MPDKLPISVVLITLNEEKKLPACLATVSWAGEIVVLDSGSTDNTRAIAEQSGARFFTRKFDNFAAQKNAAIEMATQDWILLLDADELLSPELQTEIQEIIRSDPQKQGYFLKRRNHLFGGWLRFGANGSDLQLRLIRRGAGRFEGLVHERLSVRDPGTLNAPILHYSSATMKDYLRKLKFYTQLEAQMMWQSKRKPTVWDCWVKPALYFIYYFIFRLGFLDGFRGFLYEILSSYYIFVKNKEARRLFATAMRAQ